jgi:hypothetical protein
MKASTGLLSLAILAVAAMFVGASRHVSFGTYWTDGGDPTPPPIPMKTLVREIC